MNTPIVFWIAAGALSAIAILAICFAVTRLTQAILKRAGAKAEAEERSVVSLVVRFLPQVLAIAVVPWIVGLAPKHSMQATAFMLSYAAVVICYFLADRLNAKEAAEA